MILTSSIPALSLLADYSAPVITLEPVGPVIDDTIEAAEEAEDTGTSYARCSDGHGTLSSLFFSEDDHDIARARAICKPCGLRESCLEGAVDRLEPYGVWGGKLVIDGVPVEVRPKRGRPPKHPRPVLEVDEVPIPQHLVA